MEEKMALLIKTAFGRTLLDTRKSGQKFVLAELPAEQSEIMENIGAASGDEKGPRQSSACWEFAVIGVDPELASSVVQSASLLNMFHFTEDGSGRLHKCWYYDKTEPVIGYDADGGVLKLRVDSRMPYSNDQV